MGLLASSFRPQPSHRTNWPFGYSSQGDEATVAKSLEMEDAGRLGSI